MNQIAETLYQEISTDKSLFPNVPETAINILNALDDPNCNNDTVAKIIQVDAGLSAFVLKSANSLRFYTRIPPRDLTSAIRRMGLRETYHLSVAFLSRSAFRTRNESLKKSLKDAYALSTKTAVIAYFLASHLRTFESGQALLAGLMHDIGVPAILAALSKHQEEFSNAQQRCAVIDQLGARVGLMILKDWGFEPAIMEVVEHRNHWLRNGQAKADLTDLVLIARLHALIGRPEFRNCPAIDTLPAFHKLQLGELGPDNALLLLKESQQELQAIGQLLTA